MANNHEKIPVPPSQRWREIRVRIIPFAVFVVVAGVVAWLWQDRMDATTMVGRVVGQQAEVRSPQAGALSEITVQDFDSVSAGDPVGRLITTDPKIMEAELAVVLAELELTRLSMDPFADQQRNILNYESMQMDLMENRARLAMATIRKQQAERELQRVERLDELGLTTDEAVDEARTEFRSLEQEVEVIAQLVDRLDERLEAIDLDRVPELWKEDDPRAAAIKVHQRTIEKIEAEMMPVTLEAPVSGQVSEVLKSNGEFVEQGDIVMNIQSPTPDYIIGHVRHPVFVKPEPGMEVLVRKQTRDREEAIMVVDQVGVQMETIEELSQLFPEQPFETTGLPVRIRINRELDLMPGEIVDMQLITR